MKTWTILVLLLGIGIAGVPKAQNSNVPEVHSLLESLVTNEESANAHRGRYLYMSEERSDRTGGRLWTEKVVETQQGRVRFLLAEDGVPLNAAQVASERGRLAQDVANPDAFAKREAAQANDEQHAKAMLALLPKAFLFDPPLAEGGGWRIHFKPNPAYDPQNMEERVMHGMTGSALIDQKDVRLRELDGHMDEDVSLGFGPFAVIKAGSNFSTRRQPEEGTDWKTETAHTDINGRAMLLKTMARKQDVKRWGYKRVSDSLSVAEAVALVEP